MKKIILSVLAVMTLSSGVLTATNFRELNTISANIQSEAQRVTVYMIKKRGSFVSKTRKSGSYNEDTNKITIDGDTYRVSENPYYGDDSSFGSYRYVAGGCYYFNL